MIGSVYQALSDVEGTLAENNVNQAHLVKKGNFNRVSANWVHLVTKGFSQVCSVNQASFG